MCEWWKCTWSAICEMGGKAVWSEMGRKAVWSICPVAVPLSHTASHAVTMRRVKRSIIKQAWWVTHSKSKLNLIRFVLAKAGLSQWIRKMLFWPNKKEGHVKTIYHKFLELDFYVLRSRIGVWYFWRVEEVLLGGWPLFELNPGTVELENCELIGAELIGGGGSLVGGAKVDRSGNWIGGGLGGSWFTGGWFGGGLLNRLRP